MADRYSGYSRRFHHLPFRRRKVLGRPSDRAEILFKKEAAWLSWLTSGELPVSAKRFANVSVAGAIVIFTLSLYTNQEFHNGVWGPLHNKSVKPKIEISDAQIENNSLSFSVYRVEGVDVYGSFLIGISLKNADGDIVLEKKGEELADFPIGNIDNKYIARVAPG